jgi:hypothetical protein
MIDPATELLGARSEREQLPILTIDMDGVFCRPFLGWNLGISSDFLNPDAPPRPASVPPPWIRRPWDTARFNPRRPLPDARGGLARLHEVRRHVVVTGRRTHPRWWLRRHRLAKYFDGVMVNETPLRSPHYKLDVLDRLGASEHIDDDPRTAQLLAQRSRARVYLRNWPTNRAVVLDARVQRVDDLHELADLLGAPPL